MVQYLLNPLPNTTQRDTESHIILAAIPESVSGRNKSKFLEGFDRMVASSPAFSFVDLNIWGLFLNNMTGPGALQHPGPRSNGPLLRRSHSAVR